MLTMLTKRITVPRNNYSTVHPWHAEGGLKPLADTMAASNRWQIQWALSGH
jgi:hypothetical protein